MAAILVYGSLIDPRELAKSAMLGADARPVMVDGYRRVLNQTPSWRSGVDNRRAVLSVMKSAQDVFNAVLVPLPADVCLQQLDQRERGYDRVVVPRSRVVPFGGDALTDDIETIFLYQGKPDKRDDGLLPNEDYLALCLAAASRYGGEFHQRFIETTFVRQTRLSVFLQPASPEGRSGPAES